MNLPCIALLVLFSAKAISWGAEQGYYRKFVEVFGTNTWNTSAPIPSFFTDATNTLSKLVQPVDLTKLRASGEVSGVHLGMTMDEVVALWGKPAKLHIVNSGGALSGTFRGVRFDYSDARVEFESTTNAVKMIGFDARRVWLASHLSTRSTTNDFIALLGQPDKIVNLKGQFNEFVYRTPRWYVTLTFWMEDETGKMFYVSLERLDNHSTSPK